MAGTTANPSGPVSYRPKQILAAAVDARRVAQKLDGMGLGRIRLSDGPDLVGFMNLTWEAPRDAGEVVDEVRRLSAEDFEGTPSISPNHLFAPVVDPVSAQRVDPLVGQPVDMGGPAQPPIQTKKKLRPRTAADRAGTGVTVGVIDTGVALNEWMAGSFLAGPDDFDPIDDDDDGELDIQGGHGTFVGGIVLQHAPGATVRFARVLDRNGEAEVQSVANAIVGLGRAGVDIINLSLGGYSRFNNPPMALRDALAALDTSVVVVAAAGNHDPKKHKGVTPTRKFWPAAFPSVVAVAALKPLRANQEPKRAPFSNFGDWVDVSTVGVGQVSTFVSFKDKRGPEFDGFASWNGTSFAAPAVAGAIAARMTDMKGDRVRTAKQARQDVLERDAKPFPGLREGDDQGIGRFLRLESPFAK